MTIETSFIAKTMISFSTKKLAKFLNPLLSIMLHIYFDINFDRRCENLLYFNKITCEIYWDNFLLYALSEKLDG